jgi:uncharacterized membrane protein YhaH (DUF805 family)
MNYWILKSLKDFIKFNGRSCRTESRYFLIFNIIIGLTAGLIDMIMGFTIEIIPGIPTLILLEITRGILILPNLSLVIRRLHDINKSGWWMLLFFTIVGLIPMFYWLYFKEGDQSDNNYGTIDIIIND